jgi:hypothetical protein
MTRQRFYLQESEGALDNARLRPFLIERLR